MISLNRPDQILLSAPEMCVMYSFKRRMLSVRAVT
jgi:hypothetical protein